MRDLWTIENLTNRLLEEVIKVIKKCDFLFWGMLRDLRDTYKLAEGMLKVSFNFEDPIFYFEGYKLLRKAYWNNSKYFIYLVRKMLNEKLNKNEFIYM